MRIQLLTLGAAVALCTGCATIDGQSILKTDEYVAPPASMHLQPGPMVAGPGPGVLGMLGGMPGGNPGGMPGYGGDIGIGTTQIKFIGQDGMAINWKSGAGFSSTPLIAPGSFEFGQGGTYQLRLSNFPDEQMVAAEYYATLEVRHSHPNTRTYIEHTVVPVEITPQDLQHVSSNNLVTKVIYLPDPQFQSRAIPGVETLVSTSLDPGDDPVLQAERMGTIMVVLRFGNRNFGGQMSQLATNPNSITPVAYTAYQQAGFEPPTPIATSPADIHGVPGAMIVAGGGMPGQPIQPIAGMGSMPPWGMPITGTPIGLAGPPHLPLGGPASLKSHTVRNLSDNRMPSPVDHMLIDVKHNPGYSLPEPVRHIQYTENHPVYGPGEICAPAGAGMGF